MHYFHNSLMNRFVIDININTIFKKCIALGMWCSGYFFVVVVVVGGGNHITIHYFSCIECSKLHFFWQCKSLYCHF